MTDRIKKDELNEKELEQVQGAGLLLPAVQSAREAARRDSSSKNSKEFLSSGYSTGVKRPTPKGMERVFDDE